MCLCRAVCCGTEEVQSPLLGLISWVSSLRSKVIYVKLGEWEEYCPREAEPKYQVPRSILQGLRFIFPSLQVWGRRERHHSNTGANLGLTGAATTWKIIFFFFSMKFPRKKRWMLCWLRIRAVRGRFSFSQLLSAWPGPCWASLPYQ